MIARRGFDATIEEIAEASGVSPRTVFRHFPSHDLLIAEGVKEMFSELARPIEGLPDGPKISTAGSTGCRWRSHGLDRILGRAFWDIRAPEPHNPDTMAQTLESQRLRLRWITSTAAEAWRAGGTGEPASCRRAVRALPVGLHHPGARPPSSATRPSRRPR